MKLYIDMFFAVIRRLAKRVTIFKNLSRLKMNLFENADDKVINTE